MLRELSDQRWRVVWLLDGVAEDVEERRESERCDIRDCEVN